MSRANVPLLLSPLLFLPLACGSDASAIHGSWALDVEKAKSLAAAEAGAGVAGVAGAAGAAGVDMMLNMLKTMAPTFTLHSDGKMTVKAAGKNQDGTWTLKSRDGDTYVISGTIEEDGKPSTKDLTFKKTGADTLEMSMEGEDKPLPMKRASS